MSSWEIHLKGGPRDGDRISTTELLPFLIFTEAGEGGQTTDHFYGPVSSDPATGTAVYQPVDGPDSAIAEIWEQGYDAGKEDLRDSNLERAVTNPYRRQA